MQQFELILCTPENGGKSFGIEFVSLGIHESYLVSLIENKQYNMDGDLYHAHMQNPDTKDPHVLMYHVQTRRTPANPLQQEIRVKHIGVMKLGQYVDQKQDYNALKAGLEGMVMMLDSHAELKRKGMWDKAYPELEEELAKQMNALAEATRQLMSHL